MSTEEFLNIMSIEARQHVANVRNQKRTDSRSKPSYSLIGKSKLLDDRRRKLLLDKVASLVDENLGGRSDMCIQFADLLERALNHLGIEAWPVQGQAKYFLNGEEIFQWDHAWVETQEEIVDGNVDSTCENPCVPKELRLNPYWGTKKGIPADRQFFGNMLLNFPREKDVTEIWWPELKDWLGQNF